MFSLRFELTGRCLEDWCMDSCEFSSWKISFVTSLNCFGRGVFHWKLQLEE